MTGDVYMLEVQRYDGNFQRVFTATGGPFTRNMARKGAALMLAKPHVITVTIYSAVHTHKASKTFYGKAYDLFRIENY